MCGPSFPSTCEKRDTKSNAKHKFNCETNLLFPPSRPPMPFGPPQWVPMGPERPLPPPQSSENRPLPPTLERNELVIKYASSKSGKKSGKKSETQGENERQKKMVRRVKTVPWGGGGQDYVAVGRRGTRLCCVPESSLFSHIQYEVLSEQVF